jgi:hypothetical protein
LEDAGNDKAGHPNTGFYAGRKRGAPNKATAARQVEVETSGITPLEYMLKVMRDENAHPHQRFEAAKSAAPLRASQARQHPARE